LEIKFKTEGELKTIPYIKGGKLIKLVGKNGVGKSMAAIFLEIVCGNYKFKNEAQFNQIKSRFKKSVIKIITQTDEIEITIAPGTWIYNKTEFKLENSSIGFFRINGNRVDFQQFKNFLFVKIIRGNENLETQIDLITDTFIEILDKYSLKNREFISKIKDYQNSFSKSVNIDLIKKYDDWQEKYVKSITQLEKWENRYRDLSNNFKEIENKIKIIEKIKIWEENDPNFIKQKINEINIEIEKFNKKYEENVLNLNKLEERLRDLEEHERQQVQEYVQKKQKIITEKNNFIEKINEKFPNNVKAIIKAKNLELVENLQENINKNLEDIINNFESELESKETRYLINLHNKLEEIRNIIEECIADGLGDQYIIDEVYNDIELKISIEEFKRFLDNTILLLEHNPEHAYIKEKMEELKKEIEEKQIFLKFIKEWKKLIDKEEKLRDIKKNITDNTLDQFLEPELIKQYIDKQDLLYNENSQIKLKLQELTLNLNNLQNRLELTKNLESKNVLYNQLENYYEKIPSNLETELENLITESNDIHEEMKALELNITEENKKKSQIQEKIQKIKSEILKIAKQNNFNTLNEWKEYVVSHLDKINKLLNEYLIPFSDYLANVKKSFYAIKEYNNVSKSTYIDLISEVYNQFFLNTYNKASYFEHVFKDYDSIMNFDIIKKTINFIKKDKSIDSRSLNDFSSGEKAYAFIRAMISMINSEAIYKILFIDEANALLDYIRANDLEELQIKMIEGGKLDKIINIFPIQEIPNKLNENYEKEYNEFGYYQEVLKE